MELPSNTFIQDFNIANAFGVDAIKDTYKRAQEWRTDIGMYAALCYALNYWCWRFSEKGNTQICELYRTLYYDSVDWGYDNFKGDDYNTFFELID